MLKWTVIYISQQLKSTFCVFRHYNRIKKKKKLADIRDNEQFHLSKMPKTEVAKEALNLSPKKSDSKVTFRPNSLKIVLNL